MGHRTLNLGSPIPYLQWREKLQGVLETLSDPLKQKGEP